MISFLELTKLKFHPLSRLDVPSSKVQFIPENIRQRFTKTGTLSSSSGGVGLGLFEELDYSTGTFDEPLPVVAATRYATLNQDERKCFFFFYDLFFYLFLNALFGG